MRVKNFTLLGTFHCHSLLPHPPKPGLLWPEFYFLWGHGDVERDGKPTPTEEEQMLEIAIEPLELICRRFDDTPGAGFLLKDIYRLANILRRQQPIKRFRSGIFLGNL